MPDTDTPTIAPGTTVLVPPAYLPENEHHTGPQVRTVLDPAAYGRTADEVPSGAALIATPQGWPTRVRDGLPDAGAEVNVWWVQANRVTPVPAPSATPAPTLADVTPLLTGGERDVLAVAALRLDPSERVQQVGALVNAERQAARNAQQALEDTRHRLSAAQEDRVRWAEQVRDLIVEKGREQGACDEGIARALETLGLEMPMSTWRVEVEVAYSGRVTTTVEVEALSEDGAQEVALQEAREEWERGDLEVDFDCTFDGGDVRDAERL